MVIDSSAIVAIVLKEPELARFMDIIMSNNDCVMSAPTFLKSSMVVGSRFGDAAFILLDELLKETKIEIVDFTSVHAQLARKAFRKYGKGRHPANLNFGDCMAYALAKDLGEPLLFKGNDFAKTDILSAMNGQT